MNTKSKRKGFTLVELAIVIAILGILAVVAIPKYQGMVDDARSATAKAQLATVRSAIAITYAKQQGVFPTIGAGTIGLVNKTPVSIFVEGIMPGVDIGSGASNAVAAGAASPIVVSGTTGGWIYNATTGEVRINSTAADPAANPSTTPWSSY